MNALLIAVAVLLVARVSGSEVSLRARANVRRRRRPFGADVPVSFSTFVRQKKSSKFPPPPN